MRALLEKHGMSRDMRIPYQYLEEGAEVARNLPGIPMAVNHNGLPPDRSEGGFFAHNALRLYRIPAEQIPI